jgi:hypothetical protein
MDSNALPNLPALVLPGGPSLAFILCLKNSSDEAYSFNPILAREIVSPQA